MAKFFFFEYIVGLFYQHVFTAPKDTYGKPTQLGVTFASGYIAGVVCAVVSHPADSVVSLMGKAENKGKSIGQIASEVGIAKLATGGLGTRVIMIGTLTGAYSSFFAATWTILTSWVLRLPVVDLRYLQVQHGHGYHRWQVSVCGMKKVVVVAVAMRFPFVIRLFRYPIDLSRAFSVALVRVCADGFD